jgi:hypothetical protein
MLFDATFEGTADNIDSRAVFGLSCPQDETNSVIANIKIHNFFILFLNDFPFIAEAEHEIIEAVMRIDFHHMPQKSAYCLWLP